MCVYIYCAIECLSFLSVLKIYSISILSLLAHSGEPSMVLDKCDCLPEEVEMRISTGG